jgi:hypothetical protein
MSTVRPSTQAALAGPRRVRPPALPAPRTVVVAERPAAPPASAPAPGSARALPPLDYDEPTPSEKGPRPGRLETTRPGKRTKSSRRVLWFALGIAFGATGAVFAQGDGTGPMPALRSWGANALRSLEHSAAPVAADPSSVTANNVRHPDVRSKDAPCPVDPRPGDPCAQLLAPFAPQVPTVSVDDLPRAKPAPVPTMQPVVIFARRARSAAPAPQPVAQVHEETQPAPHGINPDSDDPQATPTRLTPMSPPPASKPPADPPSSELQSARNEAT